MQNFNLTLSVLTDNMTPVVFIFSIITIASIILVFSLINLTLFINIIGILCGYVLIKYVGLDSLNWSYILYYIILILLSIMYIIFIWSHAYMNYSGKAQPSSTSAQSDAVPVEPAPAAPSNPGGNNSGNGRNNNNSGKGKNKNSNSDDVYKKYIIPNEKPAMKTEVENLIAKKYLDYAYPGMEKTNRIPYMARKHAQRLYHTLPREEIVRLREIARTKLYMRIKILLNEKNKIK